MIEQQLKAKQGGQPTPASVVSGKHFVRNGLRQLFNFCLFFFFD